MKKFFCILGVMVVGLAMGGLAPHSQVAPLSYRAQEGISLIETLLFFDHVEQTKSPEDKERTYDNFYQHIIQNKSVAEIILPNIQDFEPQKHWERIKRNYMDHQGGGEVQAVTELLSNAFDAVCEQHGLPVIGRFGMGVFQVFALLKNAEDRLIYTSTKDGVTHTLTLFLKNGQLFYTYAQTPSPQAAGGTKVSLNRQKPFDVEAIKKRILSQVSYYEEVPLEVRIEGKLLDIPKHKEQHSFPPRPKAVISEKVQFDISEQGFTICDSGVGMNQAQLFQNLLRPRASTKPKDHSQDVRFFYSPNILRNKDKGGRWIDNSTCELKVQGMTIETLTLRGYYLPEHFAIDLPGDTWVPESRDKIYLEEKQVLAIMKGLKGVVQSQDLKDEDKIVLCNAVAALLKRKFSGAQDYLMVDVRAAIWNSEAIRNYFQNISRKGFVLPNRTAYADMLESQDVFYVDDLYCDFKPESLGFEKDPSGENGWQVWVGSMRQKILAIDELKNGFF